MTAIPHPHAGTEAHGATDYDHGHAADHAHDLGFLKKYIFSADHKIIGIQFLFMGLFFMVIGGLLAMLVRWQLAWPSDPNHPVPILAKLLWGQKDLVTGVIKPGPMPPDFYTMAFSMHASIMIFFVIIPLLVGTFGNYLIPLKIGAADMAFPFLNGLAFWSAVPAGTIMLTGFLLSGGAAAAGWTSYPPLSAIMMNGGVGSFAVNLLRPEASTWPMFPIITNALAAFMFAGFICAYFVRVDRVGGIAWGIVFSIAGALAARYLGGLSWFWTAVVFFALIVNAVGISLVGGPAPRAVVSVLASLLFAIVAV